MFNLDRSIGEWRQQMLAAGIKTPVPLDELESHLWEDVRQQMKSGSDAKQAFDAAVQRIGQANELKTEFKKVRGTPKALQRLMGSVALTLTAFILWMSGFTFDQLQMSAGEEVVGFSAVVFSLLVAGGWRYAVPFLPVLLARRQRNIVGAACILLGFVCSNLFCNFILPPFERHLDGQIPAIGFWAVFPIAVGFAFASGIQEAARARVA